jgi:hypothetical protein
MRAQNVIHIHVGKCAGSTLNACLHQAGIIFTELHGRKAKSQLEAILRSGIPEPVFLVTVRDPISRFISAFNYDRLRTLRDEVGELGGLQKKIWHTVFSRFAEPNCLAEGLSSSEIGAQRLARWACSRLSSSHVGLGLAEYMSMDAVLRLPAEHTHCFHQESLSSDIPILFTKLGYPAPSYIPVINSSTTPQSIENPLIADRHKISVAGEKNLQRHLAEDYRIMRILEERFSRVSETA